MFRSQKILLAMLFLMPLIILGCTSTPKGYVELKRKVYPSLIRVRPILEIVQRGRPVKNASSTGSGVIFEESGYVLTNFHVAGHAKFAFCHMTNGERIKSKLVGADPWTDLAVLKLEPDDKNRKFPISPFGDSDLLEEGQTVMALGNPLGMSRTITVGVISCARRFLTGDGAKLPTGELTGRFNNWIQIDAAINSGNSGGPLVNTKGEVIGINTRANLQADNIAWAVPANVVKKVAWDIVKHKKVLRSYTGLEFQHLKGLGDYYDQNTKGALIRDVHVGSPAHKAGIRRGDMLLEVNGHPVEGYKIEEIPDLNRMMTDLPIDQDADFKIKRNDKVLDLVLHTIEFDKRNVIPFKCPAWGFDVNDILSFNARALKYDNSDGVIVANLKANSAAHKAGLTNNDVIMKFDNTDVVDVKHFETFFNDYSKQTGKKILMKIWRNQEVLYTIFQVPALPKTPDKNEKTKTPDDKKVPEKNGAKK